MNGQKTPHGNDNLIACAAPPLTDPLLAKYRKLAEGLPAGDRIRDGMLTCLACVEAWWKLPESKAKPAARMKTLGGSEADVVPLEDGHVKKLWDVTPWVDELDVLGKVFDGLPPGDLRNAAYHLLWYAMEITLDREPLSQDRFTAGGG